MITNCINCGAILESKVCKYCGTDYSGRFESRIDDKFKGKLTFDGKTYNVYMSECECRDICIDSFRDFDGKLHRGIPVMKHKFTLIEY